MPKKTYTSVPTDYPVCLYDDCPKAATCLCHFAYTQVTEKDNYLRLANPLLCTKDDGCRYYRDSKPVTYVRGFTNFQKKMFPGQYEQFMHILIGKFGRNAYYERRRGDTAISPKEQQAILAALRKVGVEEEMQFDAYEEHINWYD